MDHMTHSTCHGNQMRYNGSHGANGTGKTARIQFSVHDIHDIFIGYLHYNKMIFMTALSGRDKVFIPRFYSLFLIRMVLYRFNRNF